MFRGNHPARVDEKGRLKIPAEFKGRVDEIYGSHFYITSKDGKRAEVYPLKEWEKIEEKLAQIPSMNPAKQKFLDITSYYGQMADMDAQGRILLPQLLRETAKVTAEVVVFGKQTYPGSFESRSLQGAVDSVDRRRAESALGVLDYRQHQTPQVGSTKGGRK